MQETTAAAAVAKELETLKLTKMYLIAHRCLVE